MIIIDEKKLVIDKRILREKIGKEVIELCKKYNGKLNFNFKIFIEDYEPYGTDKNVRIDIENIFDTEKYSYLDNVK